MRSNHCRKFESLSLRCSGLAVSIEDEKHSKGNKIPWLWQYKRESLQQMHEFPRLYSGSLRYACSSAALVSLWVVSTIADTSDLFIVRVRRLFSSRHTAMASQCMRLIYIVGVPTIPCCSRDWCRHRSRRCRAYSMRTSASLKPASSQP